MRLRKGSNLILAAAALSMIFVAAGILFAFLRIRSVRQEKGNELKAIAILKTDQISQWYNERLSEARFFSANKLVSDYLDNCNKGRDNTSADELNVLIKPFLNSWRYDKILLFDGTGKLVYSSSPDTLISESVLKTEIDFVKGAADKIYADFVFSRRSDKPYFDITNSIRDKSGALKGIILMRSDPDKYLFPLIQSWPIPSETSENLLLAAEDDSVVFINRLRHSTAEPMHLKISLQDNKILSVQAIKGASGFINGSDYREKRVLAYLNQIPGTHWIMVAKIDRIELFSGLYIETVMMLLNIFLLILLTGVLIKLSSQAREKELLRSLLEAEEKERILNEKQALQEKESEANYRYMFESNPQPMWIYDIETLKYLEVNRAAVDLYGYTRDEFLELTLKDLRPDEDVPRLLDALSKMDDTKQYAGEWRHVTKSGEIKFVELSSHRIRFNNRDARHIMIKDITQRKLAEQTVRLLGRAVADSTACVVITDRNGNIEYSNPAFTRITGYTNEEAVGRNTNILKSGYHPREFYEHLWKTISSGNTWHGEFYNRKKSGELYWESAVISPLREPGGEINYYVAVKEDITEKKALVESLIQAKEKAVEHDKLKTAFLHNISHEIRTPLNAIIGFAGFLDQPDIPASERQDYINIIFQSSSQLLSIVNDILNISQIEAGQASLKPGPVDLSKIMKVISLQHGSDAEKKGIEFILSAEDLTRIPPFWSDESKILQVLSNLVSNAIKFTSKGRVEVGVEVNDNTVEFHVSDTGIGIPKDEKEKIFDRFYQIDHRVSREYGGTGLGLAISKAYIELLGGKISVDSEPGTGTKMSFSIPILSQENVTVKAGESFHAKVKATKLKKVLVAEDEESNYMLIHSVLKKLNIKIIRARNGREAVDFFKAEQGIELVLMDLKMPVKDGFAATREILEIAPGITIIAQTAYAFPGELEKAMSAGCTAYLTKPYGRKELLDIISKYLK
jgi:PAS domain S-box-containing protein